MTPPWLGDGPIVVGVDGSQAALNAVRWAAAEALALDASLRLVHAVAAAVPTGSDVVLDHAEKAAKAIRTSLRVEAAATVGAPGAVLLRESARAAMVCIGSRPAQGPPIGCIAKVLAEGAGCPVAIIRTRADGAPQTDGVVSVVLSDDDDTDAVLHLAMHEGRLRHATVRQIDQRTDSWVRRYPDVHVELVAAGTGRQYHRNDARDTGVGLAVVGRRDAAELVALTVPGCHPILGYPDCSVLLVRS
ncbi:MULTISPECIES: universal stress protein [Mycolicibacterium]|jgi:nucleotide-binding universal stress UspA family protein|uniref:UspA domain protein n=1 Tax=Mycolicibacterium vanbaalenii (strain DSM 7251 / JCM 13017 / BCRC 16820 / KCTC 9966 / NRRL B-24157 / PYR-1) TaxID=350058 RepID=A1T4W5_MYCVP|nr:MULTISPECIES: universal stress protein [Mycolicibacterium]ABM12215.1 UspA domain protein [Mycolicibacterium vanbaalenii PYR-1]MCV7127266.1 universal stress protein [Mycolicibacterium vanbaalenii PYR-1]MDW5611373.1 universal stress protein [Mycolicibacterium sp. D5.8-2]QZT58153.1 universal stress protein [Mycolicibacterium austroafricanum]